MKHGLRRVISALPLWSLHIKEHYYITRINNNIFVSVQAITA